MKKIIFVLFVSACLFVQLSAQVIKVSYAAASFKGPFSGKVVLFLSKESKQPKNDASSLAITPCFAVDVKNIQPGQPVVFDDAAVSFPAKLSDIERGTYYVQAVWDRNLGERAVPESAGNIYNNSIQVDLTKDAKLTYTINCTELVTEKKFIETRQVKELRVPSTLLSNFHNKPVTLDAAVKLPAEYFTQPNAVFPVLFIVFGFGGDYHRLSNDSTASQALDSIVPCITVFLDGNCPLGHSVYANSGNNGPWGDALVQEFIPQLEKQYRCNGARMLTGHSSGGFTVAWLQTHYPATFLATSASSPDPVDFRSFSKINLYNADNFFYGKDGSLNYVGTVAGSIPWFSFKSLYQMERVLYRGEQLHSFDAVFSKKGKNGEPESICNLADGSVNTTVFENWKKYDISLYLRNNWDNIKKDLDGKLRISVGRQDNFLLNYAVTLLETEMKKLNAAFVFDYYPGDHFTVSTKAYRRDQDHFLRRKYEEWLSKQ